MLIDRNGKKTLKIFEFFETRDVPAARPTTLHVALGGSGSSGLVTFGNAPSAFVVQDVATNTNNGRWIVGSASPTTESKLRRALKWLYEHTVPRPSPQKTFSMIFASMEQLQAAEAHTELARRERERAIEAGQVALAEELSKTIVQIALEGKLIHAGYAKYMTEEQFVTFVERCDRHLRLDWVKNFARPMPVEATDKIKALDALHIFDNYVVLHYDPDNRASKMTEAEIARARDPILWGVVRGTRKLYFVHDWVDDHCNLTLDKVLATLSISSLEEHR